MPVDSITLLICDRQKSVVMGYRNGQTHFSATYAAYGWMKPQMGGPAIGFNGQRVEPLTDCYALGHGYRVYNPGLRRFHSPDRLSPFGKGGLNNFTYCSGDPINYEDPEGLFLSRIFNGIYSAFRKISAGIQGYGPWVVQANAAQLSDHARRLSMVWIVGANAAGAATALGSPVLAFTTAAVTIPAFGASLAVDAYAGGFSTVLTVFRTSEQLFDLAAAQVASIRRVTRYWHFGDRRAPSRLQTGV